MIKKITSALTAAVMLTSGVPVYAETMSADTVYEAMVKGDISRNGSLDLQDVIMIAKILLGDKLGLNAAERLRGDYDGNGILDLQDAVGIAKYLAKNMKPGNAKNIIITEDSTHFDNNEKDWYMVIYSWDENGEYFGNAGLAFMFYPNRDGNKEELLEKVVGDAKFKKPPLGKADGGIAYVYYPGLNYDPS